MSTKSKVLIGILGAAAAGVVIGLLLAPEKGKDTRKKIKNTAGDWVDSVTGLWEKGKAAAEDAYGQAKSKAKHARNEAEDKASKLKEDFS